MTDISVSEELTAVNIDDVNRFFSFLGSTETTFNCVAWMDAASKAPIKGWGICHTTPAEMAADYECLVKEGFSNPTAHVTLNTTNGLGRRKEHIVSPRVLCLDLDSAVTHERIKELRDTIKPHLIVRSSPGKYHLYWKIDRTIDLETWSLYQAGLAQMYGGDVNLSDIGHLIRVPGFRRLTKDNVYYTPEILFHNDTLLLTDDRILSLFPGLKEAGTVALDNRKKAQGKVKSVAKEMLALHHLGRMSAKTPLGESLAHGQSGLGDVGSAIGVEIGKLGSRNESLYTVIREYVLNGNGEVSPESTLALAISVNASFEQPLDEDEVIKTADSAYQRGMEAREKRVERLEEKVSEVTERHSGFEYDYSTPELENRFTSVSVVERVMQRFSGHIVEVSGVLYAFNFDTRTWEAQTRRAGIISGYVDACIRDTVHDPLFLQTLCMKEGVVSTEKKRQAENRILSSSFSSGVLAHVLRFGSYQRMEISEFDSEPYSFYAQNGIVNLLTGEVREAKAHDFMLRQSSVTWDETAIAPEWEQFLSEVFAQNSDPASMVTFLQEVFGYTLTGSVSEQKVFVHFGQGSNGKSKVLEALDMLIGAYGARMQPGALTSSGKNGFQKEFERICVKFEGKRCVIVDDMDSKTKWNEGLVKNLTGTKVMARKLYEEERDIPNRAKFHVGCNERPEPESENYGIIRRICIIPYLRQFDPRPDEERRIQAMMVKEASGILKWAALGLRRVVGQGGCISYPQEVLLSIEEYRTESFSLETVLKELYEKPNSEAEGTWEDLADMVTEVNQALDSAGIAGKNVSAETLGRHLKLKLRLETKRAYSPVKQGTRVTLYLVKRLTPKQNNTNLL